MVTLNAIVINSLLKKECAAFSNVSVFGVFTLKTGHFQSAPFSNISVFISFFDEIRFHSGAM